MWLEVIQTVHWNDTDGIPPAPVIAKGMHLNLDEARALVLLRDFPGVFCLSASPRKPDWDAGWRWIAAFNRLLESGLGEHGRPPFVEAALAKCDEGYATAKLELFMQGIADLRQWCMAQGFHPDMIQAGGGE